jgi:hypothetical protein
MQKKEYINRKFLILCKIQAEMCYVGFEISVD